MLSGDDLVVGSSQTRRLLVEATYTSDLGSSLPSKDEAEFEISNLVGVGWPSA